jgi:hypothetical protein
VGKKMTEVIHIFRSPPKNTCLLLILYTSFYFDFLLDLFCRVFGRFVTREAKKHGEGRGKSKKSIWAHHQKRGFLFLPWLFCSIFLSRFWAFRNKRRSKTPPEKVLTYLLASLFVSFFYGSPWNCALCALEVALRD